jgi:hypothetical protein
MEYGSKLLKEKSPYFAQVFAAKVVLLEVVGGGGPIRSLKYIIYKKKVLLEVIVESRDGWTIASIATYASVNNMCSASLRRITLHTLAQYGVTQVEQLFSSHHKCILFIRSVI